MQFEVLLSNQYEIEVEKSIKDIKKSKETKELQSRVIRASTRSKRDDVAFHDAYSIIRIRQLRKSKQSDELGPNVWFLTTDFTLKEAEEKHYQDY